MANCLEIGREMGPCGEMARLPLEDNFDDVINKTQRGLQLSDEELAGRAGVTVEDLQAVKGGKTLYAVIRRVARHLGLGPKALEALAKKEWYPKSPSFPHGFAMFNTRFEDMTVNSYLAWDARTRLAVAFDAGADSSDMVTTLAVERLQLKYIFLTHTHRDHVAGLAELAASAPKAEVWSHEKEPVDLPQARTFREEMYFHAGELSVKTLATPGHSPGQTTFVVKGLSYPLAIVGDAMFSCSLGGSPTGFVEQRKNTEEKIMTLPRITVLAPGHGPLTTVIQERKHSPFFAG